MSWKRFTGIAATGLLIASLTAGTVAAQSPTMNTPSFDPFDLQNFFAQLNRSIATPNINLSLFENSISASHASSSTSAVTSPVRQTAPSSSSSTHTQPAQNVTAPSGSSSLDQDRQQVFELVNQARAQAGLPAYTYNDTLQNEAQAYAEKMNSEDFFSHVAPDGQTLVDRAHQSGYYQPDGRSYYYGENIAVGQTSPQQVMTDWLNSPDHRAAILSKTYKEIGIGRSGNYWVQEFGGIY